MLLGDENEHSERGAEQEVTSYFDEKPSPRNTNPLEWWRMNEHQFSQIGKKKKLCFRKISPKEALLAQKKECYFVFKC